VDAVCVYWNESPAQLMRFAESLARAWSELATDRRGRVVLVDNGAGTGPVVADRLREALGADVELLSFTRNAGPTLARNRAFEQVSADYAAAFDADGAPAPNSLTLLADALDAHPDAALTAARVVPFDFRPAPSTAAEVRELEWGPAGATLYRREALEELGGFDPLFVWACEDLDFGHRARAAGWRCLEVGAATFAHEEHGRATVRRTRLLTEYMLMWRHIHFSRSTLVKSCLVQLPLLVRTNPGRRAAAFIGGTLGLLAYLRHIPACERRRR
jgi:GT2 family glycosyltransferase